MIKNIDISLILLFPFENLLSDMIVWTFWEKKFFFTFLKVFLFNNKKIYIYIYVIVQLFFEYLFFINFIKLNFVYPWI